MSNNQRMNFKTAKSVKRSVFQLGFWTAVFMVVTAAASFLLAITLAPARSGPFCLTDSCITYPYTNAAAFVPIDYLWMIPAFITSLLFIVLAVCIHQYASDDKKVFTQVALSLAIVSGVALAANYFIQLYVLQPSLVKGEIEGLSLFSQYNPHGIFIALEDLGYLIMGITFLFLSTAFSGPKKLERAVRLLFITVSVLAMGSLIFLSLFYGLNLEYIYEVLIITVNWITLIISGILLSVFFKRLVQIDSRKTNSRDDVNL